MTELNSRTVTNVAQDALKNFEEMVIKMQSTSHGNDPEWSEYWPDEEALLTPLRKYLNKNRELKKELERIYSNYV